MTRKLPRRHSPLRLLSQAERDYLDRRSEHWELLPKSIILRILRELRKKKNPMRIPEKVLAWRERQRKGSIMKPATFRGIKRKAARGGYAIPSAVGGKAYWITTLRKYLDKFPKDKIAMKTLRKLLGIKRKRSIAARLRGGTFDESIRVLKRRAQRRLSIRRNPEDFYLKRREATERLFRGSVGRKKRKEEKWYIGYYPWKKGYPSFQPFLSDVKPTRKTHGHLFTRVVGPFNQRPTFREWLSSPPYEKLPRMK